jgi:hypothetical protein
MELSRLILDNGLCTTHCIHTVQGFMMAVFSEAISGFVAMILAERTSGAIGKLQALLKMALLAMARPHQHTPPPDETTSFIRHRNAFLELILCRAKTENLERMRSDVLRFCLQTDFRDTRGVDVYVGNLADEAIPTYLDSWAATSARVLLPEQHKFFARHRWVLAFQPALEAALLLGCCGLLRRVARAWVRSLHGSHGVHLDPSADDIGLDGLDPGLDGPDPGNAGASAADIGEALVLWEAQDQVLGMRDADTGAPEKAEDIFRARNAKNQNAFIAFAENELSLVHLLATVINMRVMVSLMQRVLYVDSPKWETVQRNLASQGKQRSYRMLEAISGALTGSFYADTVALMGGGAVWDVLDTRLCTGLLRSQVFAQQAMAIGGIWFFLDFAWSKNPWDFFRLFLPGESAEASYNKLRRTPTCLWGTFLQKLCEKLPTRIKMLSTDARAFFIALLLLWRLSISHIECRHAALRRLIICTSFAKSTDFVRLGAAWLLARARLLEAEGVAWHRPWEQDPIVVQDRARKEKKKAGGRRGGACRAFLGDWWHFHKGTTQEGHTAWKAVKTQNGEEYAYWCTIGAAGTQQAHAGSAYAFQAPNKQAKRHKKQTAAQAYITLCIQLTPLHLCSRPAT